MELKQAVALAWVVVSLTAVSAQDQPRGAVPLLARPFPLTAVRLLDGPFKDAMVRDQASLLALDQDRLLHSFRLTAGLPTTATPFGGWEAPDVELRGHTAGHYLSAVALMYAATGDLRFKQRGDALVTALAAIQSALAARGFNPGYLSAFPEELIDRVEARTRVWAPYYTLHKMMAGLLDMHQLCGNQQALDVLLKQVAWVRLRMDRLTHTQQQAMLQTEFGGMNEVLASLYGVTGDPEHLRLARLFDHAVVFDPLARQEDTLDGLHANTQIPKVIGAAREYELTGEARYRDIATFFWDRVARHRSYANGGHSNGEIFFPVDQFAKHLGGESSETCNTYNMLKLTRHLFEWGPSADKMDFYERGLYNHILASQDPVTGGVIYYCPLKPGAWKSYSTSDRSFWCCVGTGLENHAKYADTIYFQADDALLVNLFIPSELTWKERGLVVRQTTTFPEEGRSRLAFTADRPVRLTLRVRHPSWVAAGFAITINGVRQPLQSTPGSYVSIVREWTTGDTVDVDLPMSLRQEPLPGTTDTVAIFYGPILLAGDLGVDGLDQAKRYGPSAPPLSKAPSGRGAGAGRRRSVRAAEGRRAGGQPSADVSHRRRRPAARRHADAVLPDEPVAVLRLLEGVPAGGVGRPRGHACATTTSASRDRHRRPRHAGQRAGARLSRRSDDAAGVRRAPRPRDPRRVVQLRPGGGRRRAGRPGGALPRQRGTPTGVRRAGGRHVDRQRDAALPSDGMAGADLPDPRGADPRQAEGDRALPAGRRRAHRLGVRGARGRPSSGTLSGLSHLFKTAVWRRHYDLPPCTHRLPLR